MVNGETGFLYSPFTIYHLPAFLLSLVTYHGPYVFYGATERGAAAPFDYGALYERRMFEHERDDFVVRERAIA